MKIEIVGQVLSPREVVLKNGNKRTYAYFVSKDDGKLYNVESDEPLQADSASVLYKADIVWGKCSFNSFDSCSFSHYLHPPFRIATWCLLSILL